MASNEDVLRSIDAKVSGVLVLMLDSYLRETGIAKPKPRSIDKMLSDVGLDVGTISSLLGKTDRAVQLQLQKERSSKGKAKKAKT